MLAAPLASRTPARGGSTAKFLGANGEMAGAGAARFARGRLSRVVFRARAVFARRLADAARFPAIRPLPAFASGPLIQPFRRKAIRLVSPELTRGKAVLMSRPRGRRKSIGPAGFFCLL